MKRLLALLPVLIAFQAGAPPALAWTWPADGPVLRAFALGEDPYAAGQHRGIDVAGEAGARIRSPAAGVVSFAGTVPGGGRTVTVETADGYSVTLVHVGTIAVTRETVVSEGATVGTIGPTGDVEHGRPYVHLGVRVTSDAHGYLDPLRFLPGRLPVPPAPPAPPAEPAPAPPRWTRRSRPYPRPLLQRPRRRLRRRRRRLPLLRHRPRRLRRRLLRLRSPAQSVRRLHATGPSREQPSLSPPPASPLQNGAPACESRSRPTDPSVLLRRALLTCLPSPAGVRRSALPWLRAHSWAIRGWVARPTPGRPTIRAARSSGSL